MESFDNKMNDIFNKDFPDVPEGFGWEENKDAIYSKMDAEEKPRRRAIFWWFWGSISALTVALIIATIYYTNDSSESNTKIATLENITPIEQITSSNNDDTPNVNINKTSSDKSVVNNEEDQENTDQKVSPKTKITSSKNPPAQLQTNQTNQRSFTDIKRSKTSDINSNSDAVLKTNPPHNVEDTTLKVVNPHYKRELIIFPFLATKNFIITRIDNKVTFAALVPKRQSEENLSDNTEKNKYKHSVSLAGGTLLSTGNYDGIVDRNTYSKWLPGYHTTFGYNVERDRLSLDLFYDHNFAVQLFDFQSQDSVEVTQSQETIVTDAYTKTTRNFSSTNYTNTARSRDYKTYNTFRSHSLGLSLLFKVLESNKLSIQTGLGGRYSFANKTKGYTLLSNGEVANYTTANSIYKSNRFDLTGTIRMSYQLNDKFALAPYIRWNRTISNRSIETDITLKGSQILAGIGLSYSLK